MDDDAQDKRVWDTLKLNGDSKVAWAIRQQIQFLVLHGAVKSETRDTYRNTFRV